MTIGAVRRWRGKPFLCRLINNKGRGISPYRAFIRSIRLLPVLIFHSKPLKQAGKPPSRLVVLDRDSQGLLLPDELFDWSFPANKFTNTSWLGRVHRGTP